MDPFEPNDFDDLIVDPNKDYLEELVGEGKKYKTPQELARAAAEKEAFIKRLERENAGIRDELKTKATMQEFLDKMNSNRQQAEPPPQEGNTEDNSSTIKPEDLEALVEKTLQKKQTEAQAKVNYETVVNTLRDVFGNDAPKVIAQKAEELGMQLQTLKEIAQTNPKAFLRLVEADKPTQKEDDFFSGPIQTNTRSSVSGLNTVVKNFEHFEKIRQKNPTEYYTPAVQNEMFKWANKLGDKFFE